jgi:hypothetical protein
MADRGSHVDDDSDFEMELNVATSEPARKRPRERARAAIGLDDLRRHGPGNKRGPEDDEGREDMPVRADDFVLKRDARRTEKAALNAEVNRLKQEIKSRDDQLAKIFDDRALRAKIAALEHELKSKDEQLRKLADNQRGRVNDPSDLADTPEWAAQVENLVFLLHAMRAKIVPGSVLRADMLMRESVWSLVQPEYKDQIREFLTKEEPQDQWLCWISILEGKDGVDCACNPGEGCIGVKKEGSVHVFRHVRADMLRKKP